MMPGIDPRQLKQAMKKMGMQQQEIDADEVIIKTGSKNIIIKNPSVAKVTMMGEESFQISGEIIEEEISADPEISDDDIETVAEQAGCSKEDAEEAIKRHKGDLAKAIMEFEENNED